MNVKLIWHGKYKILSPPRHIFDYLFLALNRKNDAVHRSVCLFIFSSHSNTHKHYIFHFSMSRTRKTEHEKWCCLRFRPMNHVSWCLCICNAIHFLASMCCEKKLRIYLILSYGNEFHEIFSVFLSHFSLIYRHRRFF